MRKTLFTQRMKNNIHDNQNKHCQRHNGLKALSTLTQGSQQKKIGIFLGICPKPVDRTPPPPPPCLGTFRNKNVTFGQKESGFQGENGEIHVSILTNPIFEQNSISDSGTDKARRWSDLDPIKICLPDIFRVISFITLFRSQSLFFLPIINIISQYLCLTWHDLAQGQTSQRFKKNTRYQYSL